MEKLRVVGMRETLIGPCGRNFPIFKLRQGNEDRYVVVNELSGDGENAVQRGPSETFRQIASHAAQGHVTLFDAREKTAHEFHWKQWKPGRGYTLLYATAQFFKSLGMRPPRTEGKQKVARLEGDEERLEWLRLKSETPELKDETWITIADEETIEARMDQWGRRFLEKAREELRQYLQPAPRKDVDISREKAMEWAKLGGIVVRSDSRLLLELMKLNHAALIAADDHLLDRLKNMKRFFRLFIRNEFSDEEFPESVNFEAYLHGVVLSMLQCIEAPPVHVQPYLAVAHLAREISPLLYAMNGHGRRNGHGKVNGNGKVDPVEALILRFAEAVAERYRDSVDISKSEVEECQKKTFKRVKESRHDSIVLDDDHQPSLLGGRGFYRIRPVILSQGSPVKLSLIAPGMGELIGKWKNLP